MYHRITCKNPEERQRSLGSYMILDAIRQAAALGLPHVYLGYWVSGSRKMEYKAKFQPLQVLTPAGWTGFDTLDIDEDTDFNG